MWPGWVQDFFGGITTFTRQQLQGINGYGTNFWGCALLAQLPCTAGCVLWPCFLPLRS